MALIPIEHVDHDPPLRRVGEDGVERVCLSSLKCWDEDGYRWLPEPLKKLFRKKVVLRQYWTEAEIAWGKHLNKEDDV